MEAPIKLVCLFGFVLILVSIGGVDGVGECGKGTTPDNEAMKLAPCGTAAQDENASVSQSCCAQVKRFGQKPSCLCAVLLSDTAKMSGVNPQIAITIPKRCNFANRPSHSPERSNIFDTRKNKEIPHYVIVFINTLMISNLISSPRQGDCELSRCLH